MEIQFKKKEQCRKCSHSQSHFLRVHLNLLYIFFNEKDFLKASTVDHSSEKRTYIILKS